MNLRTLLSTTTPKKTVFEVQLLLGKMKILKITKKRARRIAIYSSLINSDRIRSRGKKGFFRPLTISDMFR